MQTWLLALLAAVVVAIVIAALKRPREWAKRMAQRIRLAISLRRHEDMERAIERIADVMAQQVCRADGNPDDELYSDWYRWLTGDPDANVDYARKQRRDRERLARGEFAPG